MGTGFTFNLVSFVFSTIRVMTPILYASLACMVFRKGGIDSIATEGIMLTSALFGVVGAYFTNTWVGGIAVACLCGIILSFVFGYVTLTLKSNPVLAGIALNIFAGGITIFLIFYLTGEKGSTQSLANPTVPALVIPVLKDIPGLGKALSGHNLLTYLAFVITGILNYVIYKTPTGLRIRTVGESEEAAKSVGISVMKYKYITLAIAGALAALGGAFMSLGYVSFFSKDMIAGRGFIGMAADSMGRGNPIGVMLAALLFSFSDAFAIQLRMMDFPSEILQLFPYLVTIVAIAVYSYYVEKNKNNPNKKAKTVKEE